MDKSKCQGKIVMRSGPKGYYYATYSMKGQLVTESETITKEAQCVDVVKRIADERQLEIVYEYSKTKRQRSRERIRRKKESEEDITDMVKSVVADSNDS